MRHNANGVHFCNFFPDLRHSPLTHLSSHFLLDSKASSKEDSRKMLPKFIRFLKKRPTSVDDFLAFPEGKRIYREFHELRRDNMDPDAIKVLNRLNRHRHRSYLVGGCVRDLLLGRRPKDYDIVTSATPAQVRKIFANSRSIGRRFKIVHVVFRRDKIIEVSTFRSLPEHRLQGKPETPNKSYIMKRDNRYGSPKEDAARRDFSINALFFDIRNECIVDYVNGVEDIKKKRIVAIGDPDISFKEDPVRMLRAAKFAALLDFSIDSRTRKAIKHNKQEIHKASSVRLLEEYYKLFRTGHATKVMAMFHKTGLFREMFRTAANASDLSKHSKFEDSSIGRRFVIADKMLSERENLTTVIYLSLILADLVKDVFQKEQIEGNVQEYVRSNLKQACSEMNIPARDRERLFQMFMAQNRFERRGRRQKTRPEAFRKKVFFYESFMLYKIHALATGNDEAVQNAMFWEVGLRMSPPDPAKVVTTFFPRKRRQSEGGSKRSRSTQRNYKSR